MASSLPVVAENGSVMEQMLKLFEPPGGYTPDRDTELHPYFKRPGRGHNHDTCDSCREGGALICCDSCPASFHLQCHDPPLEDEDIPEGDWMCIKCYAAKPELLKQTTKKSEVTRQTSRKLERIDEKPEIEKKQADGKAKKKEPERDWRPKKRKGEEGEERPKRASRMLKKTKYNDNSTEEEFSESEFLEIDLSRLSPVKRRTYMDIYRDHMERKPRTTSVLFKSLVKAANAQNAEEFSLPKSIYVPEKFPYAWKWSTAERKLKSQMSEEGDSRGKLKVCYVCVRSSRVGPLIQCDFCPCLFHMDCLDPPLAELPSDVWMCPNHVESLLDSRLTSARITERVKLWDTYANQPVDTNDVKLTFMKKCSRQNRFKRKANTVAARKLVQVPGFIRLKYRQPTPLLPGPGYDRWVDPVIQRRSSVHKQQPDKEAATNVEERMLCDTPENEPCQESEVALQQKEVDTESKEASPSEENVNDAPTIQESEPVEVAADKVKDQDPASTTSSESDKQSETPSPLEHTPEDVTKPEETPRPTETDKSALFKTPPRNRPQHSQVFEGGISKLDTLATYTEDELEWVSSLVSLQTALLRKKMGQATGVQEDSLQCEERLPSQDRFEDRSPDSSTVSGVSLSGKVASEQQLMEQLQEYLLTHTEVDNLDPIVLKYLAAKQIQDILPTRISGLKSNVMVRASLTPVGTRKQPFYMQYRTLDIGIGPQTNLNLRDFGHCNHLSDRHATLFFDELSGQYELVNYSQHGTLVDECMYTLDIGCVAKRYKKSKKSKSGSDDPVTMAGRACSLTPCYCPAEGEEGGEGFEGSALLHHGTKIKFGCLEFVFAVAAVLAR